MNRVRLKKAISGHRLRQQKPLSSYNLCPDYGQPMLPKGEKKKPNEYDHASGCPREPKKKRSV